MYKLTHIIGFLLLCNIAYGIEIILQPEVPVSYVFSDMTYSTEDIGESEISYKVTFGGDGVSTNEGFIMQIYADKYSSTPLYTWDWTNHFSHTTYEITYGIYNDALEALQNDSEGRIEFELTSGTITILSVEVWIPDGNGGALTQSLTSPEHLNELTPNGIPYFWLANLGYNSNWELAELDDPDNDGFLNWQEYTTDTNPNDSSDYLKISVSGGNINFESSSSCLYTINYCDDLQYGRWNLLTNNISGNGNVMFITPSHTVPTHFYKITAKRKPE